MVIKHICRKGFKYGSIQYKAGDEFQPADGRWDDQILNPANGFVVTKQVKEFTCSTCGRDFNNQQGLAAHSRRCKGGK